MKNLLNIFLISRIVCDWKIVFLIFKKPFLMDNTRTADQKWLVNELVFSSNTCHNIVPKRNSVG